MDKTTLDTSRPWAAVVLAAGKGTRMKSALPKVLHPLLGRPLLGYVLALLDMIDFQRKVVVIGHKAEMVQSCLDSGGISWVIQSEQLGTGHAVLMSRNAMRGFCGNVLILCGDTPLLTYQTMARFIAAHDASGSDLSILSAELRDPTGYGRIVRKKKTKDELAGIVEEKDASSEIRAICEINTGIYAVNSDLLYAWLESVNCDNAQGEYYLTDIAGLAVGQGHKVRAFQLANPKEALGVNSRQELASAGHILLQRIRNHWMNEGVTFLLPETIYIEPDVQLSRDVTISSHVVLEGKTTVGAGAVIGPFSYLRNATVPPNEVVPPYSKLCDNVQC